MSNVFLLDLEPPLKKSRISFETSLQTSNNSNDTHFQNRRRNNSLNLLQQIEEEEEQPIQQQINIQEKNKQPESEQQQVYRQILPKPQLKQQNEQQKFQQLQQNEQQKQKQQQKNEQQKQKQKQKQQQQQQKQQKQKQINQQKQKQQQQQQKQQKQKLIEQQSKNANAKEQEIASNDQLPKPFEIICNSTGEIIYTENMTNEDTTSTPKIQVSVTTPGKQGSTPTLEMQVTTSNLEKQVSTPEKIISKSNNHMAIIFSKTDNSYTLHKDFRGIIVDGKEGYIIKFRKVKENKNSYYFCERCEKHFLNCGKFVGHFGSHFKMKCYCEKEFNSLSGIRKCSNKNDCSNFYKNKFQFNPDNQIEIGYYVPDDYLTKFKYQIPSKKRKPTQDARWTLSDHTIVFKGYSTNELEFHHKWVRRFREDNYKKTNQDKDSRIMYENEGRYRSNCTPRASCASSLIARFFKFLYFYKGLEINEVSYRDFFNFEYFEVFFRYYSDTHEPGTIGNNIDNYKIVLNYINQNIDVFKEYNAEFNSLVHRCIVIAGIQVAKSKTSKYFVVDNKSNPSGNAATLLSTHLEELNAGRMLSEDEMCGIFHYLMINFKNISTIMDIITLQRISDDDLNINNLYWQSLLMNMQFYTYHLFGLAFFGQRAQITKYLNIDNFVAMENILGYVPTGEKTSRKDSIIPIPNWIIPIYLVQLKIRKLLLKMAPKLYDNNKCEIKNDYRSLFINSDGKPFTIRNFNDAIHAFKYMYADISVSFSRSYRRGVFTLYVSANFDRFYSLLNIDDSRMMSLLSKAFNTSETIIKKYYIRSNSIARVNDLTSSIRSSFIGDENQMNFDKYELSSEFCKDANIKEVKYHDNPTGRSYICYDNKNSKFNLMENEKLIKLIDPYDVITLKIDEKLKVPMFKIPNIPNLSPLKKNKAFIGVNEPIDINKISIRFNDNGSLLSLQRQINSSDIIPKQILSHKSDNNEHMKKIDIHNCLFKILWSNNTSSWENNYYICSSKFNELYEKYIMKLFKESKLEYKFDDV